MSDKLGPPEHEHHDVPTRVIVIFCGGMGAAVVLMGALAAWLYPGQAGRPLVPGPFPAAQAPVLQQNTAADMDAFRRAQYAQLGATFWVDRAHGVVGIPIEQAMADIARDGIPGWPK